MTDTDPTDLVQLVSGFAAKLPQTEHDNGLSIFPEMLPALPSLIETDQLVVKRGYHDYGGWRIDYPEVFGPKPAYEALGIVTAAVLLRPELDSVTIRLANPNSEVRKLRIEFRHTDRTLGLHQVPVLFDYFPDQVKRKPWLHEPAPDPEAYPGVVLTNDDDFLISEDDWNSRDVLAGFGSAYGTARLIQLFLDMSRDSNDCQEVLLEGEAGFRGVAPASAEIRFWLPGGEFFDDSDFA